jgi:hypothetical protein
MPLIYPDLLSVKAICENLAVYYSPVIQKFNGAGNLFGVRRFKGGRLVKK